MCASATKFPAGAAAPRRKEKCGLDQLEHKTGAANRGVTPSRLFDLVSISAPSPPTPQGSSKSGAVDMRQTATLENGNLRPETFGKTRQELPRVIAGPPVRPVLGEASYGNVALSCAVGNHVDLRGLPGGAEGIRTDGHCHFAPSN